MCLHYQWTLPLRLRPDTPDVFVEELRYHLGLSDRVPQDPTLDVDGPALTPSGDGDELAGGPSTSLVLQQPTSSTLSWGVFARILVLDDAMYDLVQVVPPWLARWSLTSGWIGFAREEMDLNPWLTFYVASGHAYAASPSEVPQPLADGAPPFRLRQSAEL